MFVLEIAYYNFAAWQRQFCCMTDQQALACVSGQLTLRRVAASHWISWPHARVPPLSALSLLKQHLNFHVWPILYTHMLLYARRSCTLSIYEAKCGGSLLTPSKRHIHALCTFIFSALYFMIPPDPESLFLISFLQWNLDLCGIRRVAFPRSTCTVLLTRSLLKLNDDKIFRKVIKLYIRLLVLPFSKWC